jgi:predicted lipoprotein with Yx(FWY)xxD motif
LSVATVGGVTGVLVDAAGKPLYTPAEEADGTVHCTGACATIWVPVAAPANASMTGPSGVTLTVISRPDGTKQLAAAGKPLYTFAQDSAGQLKGNGVADDFGGQHFTWHVVQAAGAPAPSMPATTSSGGGGYNY